MSIASEISNIYNDITNAKTAITGKGGTVSGKGSSTLATEINSIPSIVTETFDVTPTTSDQTITPSAGKYFNIGTVRAMPNGSRGSLSVSKSISGTTATITAKEATGTAGYINPTSRSSSSTTVTASDLTSGTQSITTNGTYDVTSKKSVSVNVEGRKYATGTWNYSANTTLATIGSVNCGFKPSIFLIYTQETPTGSSSSSTNYITSLAIIFRTPGIYADASAFALYTTRTSSSTNTNPKSALLSSITATSTGISISSSNAYTLLKSITYKWEAWGE